MQQELFEQFEPRTQALGPEALLLRGFASDSATLILDKVDAIAAIAPFRHMETPGGYRMSVAMTNCGQLGWVTDRAGYRYAACDPLTERVWPAMPEELRALARAAAARAGFHGFKPDACLINCYKPGARLSLHQDKDETDLRHPVVSLSLGLPATFQFGGPRRTDKVAKVALRHGDVVVWGGVDRLRYHGILALKDGCHPQLGERRINLTFRVAR